MVPKFNLADPTVEPTDPESGALSVAARDIAYGRNVVADERFRAEIR